MFAQFRGKYPTGSLISELITINQGHYVVRVLVEVEGVILATGLAAADTVEAAEDAAQKRSLMTLGLQPVPHLAQSHSTSELATSKVVPPQALAVSVSEEVSPEKTFEEPPTTPKPEESFPSESLTSQDWLSATYISPKLSPTQSPESTTTSRSPSKSRGASLPPLPPPPSEPLESSESYPSSDELNPSFKSKGNVLKESMDLSSDIAKTDIELRRLGWTPQQGRAHLEKTYGKRSRQLLTEEELLDFLHYLESLSSPVERDDQ